MTQTGTYVLCPGQGLVQVSREIPRIASSVWMPKGDRPHYDPSARCRFESKADKRAWMSRYGLKEGGLITNPDKRWDGPTKNARKISWQRQQERARFTDWVKTQGGVTGLLDRAQRQQERHV